MDINPVFLLVLFLVGVVVPLILAMHMRRRKRELARRVKEQRRMEQAEATTAQLDATKHDLDRRSIEN